MQAVGAADAFDRAWLADVQAKWDTGMADSAAGRGIEGTAAQHMARIRARIEPA